MKTVIDAVNELKGDLNNAAQSEITIGYLKFSLVTYTWMRSKSSIANHSYSDVCTINEFNDLVSQMKTNFGKCSGVDAAVYAAGTKQLLTNSAPKPQSKPIFTQGMCDNGELPSVGMECLINFPDIDNAWYKYTIDYMGKHTFIATCEDVSERFGHIDDVYFKPLTPPITLIDGKAYQFGYRNIETCGVYSKDHNLLYSADSIIDISDCTNIQPLTVEVK